MKQTRAKFRIVSIFLGVTGALFFISGVASLNSSGIHVALHKAGAAFTFIAFALEPEVLFKPITHNDVKAAANRPHLITRIYYVGFVCYLLAVITWLVS